MKTFSLRPANHNHRVNHENRTHSTHPSSLTRCASHVSRCRKTLRCLVLTITLLLAAPALFTEPAHNPFPVPPSGLWFSLAPGIARADVSTDFNAKFNALKPPENSSVHSDYLFQQIALGSQYNIRLLNRLNTSSDKTNAKLDTLLEKFDLLLEQNRKIIDLLEKQQAAE